MTQDVLRRHTPGGPPQSPPPVNPAAFGFPAVQPPDPDATVVIGRHRAVPAARPGFVGRVAAATVAAFRFTGRPAVAVVGDLLGALLLTLDLVLPVRLFWRC